jgi:hypothetical protein
MELLIPGLILVALMIWASTRIKRNAAAAFDAETVETADFVINKPDGFLHVLNDDSGLAFRAYSKEFGKVGNRDVRQATIEIELHQTVRLDAATKRIKSESESIGSIEAYIDGGERAASVASRRIGDGGEYETLSKLVTRGQGVWECRYSVLSEHLPDHLSRMESVLGSLRVK